MSTNLERASTRKPKVGAGLPRNATPAERFKASHTIEENGCWLWLGRLDHGGYGEFRPNGERWRAHRWSYTQKHGPIPDGLQLDHFVCNNPACVNPDHVRPVTQRENLLRGETVGAVNLAKTHCKRGHLLPEARNGVRRCAECRRLADRQRAAAKPKVEKASREKAPLVRGDRATSMRGALAALLASRVPEGNRVDA